MSTTRLFRNTSQNLVSATKKFGRVAFHVAARCCNFLTRSFLASAKITSARTVSRIKKSKFSLRVDPIRAILGVCCFIFRTRLSPASTDLDRVNFETAGCSHCLSASACS